MQRTLIIIGLLTLSMATVSTQAVAQGKKGGGNRRGRIQVNINTNFNKYNKFKYNGNYKYKNFKYNHFKYNKYNVRHVNFHPAKRYCFSANHKYFYNIKYFRWSHFPYRVCVYNNQYWVMYGNQWMPYHYLVQNHQGCWNWHHKHFHKIKHTKVNAKFYKFKK